MAQPLFIQRRPDTIVGAWQSRPTPGMKSESQNWATARKEVPGAAAAEGHQHSHIFMPACVKAARRGLKTSLW